MVPVKLGNTLMRHDKIAVCEYQIVTLDKWGQHTTSANWSRRSQAARIASGFEYRQGRAAWVQEVTVYKHPADIRYGIDIVP